MVFKVSYSYSFGFDRLQKLHNFLWANVWKSVRNDIEVMENIIRYATTQKQINKYLKIKRWVIFHSMPFLVVHISQYAFVTCSLFCWSAWHIQAVSHRGAGKMLSLQTAPVLNLEASAYWLWQDTNPPHGTLHCNILFEKDSQLVHLHLIFFQLRCLTLVVYWHIGRPVFHSKIRLSNLKCKITVWSILFIYFFNFRVLWWNLTATKTLLTGVDCLRNCTCIFVNIEQIWDKLHKSEMFQGTSKLQVFSFSWVLKVHGPIFQNLFH